MLNSVRTRLTLWYVGVLALVLVSFSIGVYVLLSRSLYARLDDDLQTTLKETGLAFVREVGHGEQEAETASNMLDEHIGPRQAAAIYNEAGQLLAENMALGGIHARMPPPDSISEESIALYTIPEKSGEGRRVAAQRINAPSSGKTYLIVVNQPLDVVSKELKIIRLTLYLAILGALALAGLGGWFLARRSLAPVVEMMERAHRISAENLEQRLPVANPHDELGRLAATFNELLARLDDSFAQQRRFMADASHELRTPLSVMRTATGVTLEQDWRSESEYREALRMIDVQARRLTRIVEDMFTLSRADAGRRAVHHNDFYLDELICETVSAAEVLATRKGIEIDVGKLHETPYRGDEGLLRQMILNLLDNAIKHTPTGGTIRVSLEKLSSQYRIIVSDTGTGIPQEAQAHIFERFFRADKARSRTEATEAGAGAGLGLSIAKYIAEAHRGTLDLQHSDQTGSTFAVFLPLGSLR